MSNYALRHGMKFEKESILVSHINIRQSISILIIKLILVDLLAAFLVGILFITINFTELALGLGLNSTLLTFTFFLSMAVLKLLLSGYIILDWLNAYYELTPQSLIQRHGIVFIKEERVNFSDIRKIVLKQGLLGKIFNFGTIELYDFLMKKSMNVFLIHNPWRYEKIILDLIPELEEEKSVIREKVFNEAD